MRLLFESFERVLFAQAEIAAVNTVLTAIYLYGVLGFMGSRLPMTETLLVITFVAGLIPVAGNVISNTIIVLLSLGISPWVAVLSLAFLVIVHKLEYLLNAKIVGVRIHAAAWETLLALFVMEAAFGPRGVVVAPVLYAYIKRELSEKELV
jgi:predicted PurR-regulated permease PerM